MGSEMCIRDRSSNDWVGRECRDSAHVAGIPGHVEVALVAPARAPRVLHDPVLVTRGRLVVAKEGENIIL